MNSFKASFLFKNDDQRETRLGPTVLLRMETFSPVIARVYFVNDGSTEINVLAGSQKSRHHKQCEFDAVHEFLLLRLDRQLPIFISTLRRLMRTKLFFLK
jgi:hypothetical protein